jgi:hypothetical protein
VEFGPSSRRLAAGRGRDHLRALAASRRFDAVMHWRMRPSYHAFEC